MADTAPKPFVFVLMPFDKAFDDIYESGIKAACDEGGAYCERVDKQIYDGSILAHIYNQIAKADIIVADMSGRNPNVFYEVGYAHALDKQVILLIQNAADIAFDLTHHPHIVYSGRIVELKLELTKRVRWCVANPKRRLEIAEQHLEAFLQGISVKDSPTIPIHANQQMFLQIHNATPRAFPPQTTRIGIILPNILDGFYHYDARQLKVDTLPNDEGVLALFPAFDTFLPSTWETVRFTLLPNAKSIVRFGKYKWIVRLFTELRSIDYPINIEIGQ